MIYKKDSLNFSDNKKQDLPDFEIPASNMLNAENTLQIYEKLRPILPKTKVIKSEIIHSVRELLDMVDGLILDGYGIINVGEQLTPEFNDFFTEISLRKLPFVILTNGASRRSEEIIRKYKSWGLNLNKYDLISSRDVLEEKLLHKPKTKIMRLSKTTAPLKHCFNLNHGVGSFNNKFHQAEAFAFMGSINWTETQQHAFETALKENPRPVFVANPDVSAPQENWFSAEPGYWVVRAMKQAVFPVEWFGKPYPASYQMATKILQKKTEKPLQQSRIAMIGDSLHTDILGANAAGLVSVLVSNYGLMRGLNVLEICDQMSIHPHFIAPTL